MDKVKLPCIVCDKDVEELNGFERPEPKDYDKEMWNEGGIAKLRMNYGSRYDSDVYIFAICDDCIERLMEDNRMIYLYNYMFPEYKEWG